MNNLLTTKDVADLLQCHPQSVYRNKELPYIKIPGIGIRYKESELDKYVEQKSIKACSLIASLNPANSFKLTNLDEFDKIYLQKNKGGISGSMNRKKTRWRYANGTVYLRENPGGTKSWGIEHRDETGSRRQMIVPNAHSRSDAVIALYKKVREVFNLQNSIVQPKKITFCEFAELYLRDYAMVAKKSGNTDEFRLRKMKKFFKDIELRNITPLMIQKFRGTRLDEGITKVTTNREVALLKKMFNMAIEEGYLEQNAAKKVKLFSEIDTVKDRVLTKEEEESLFEALAEHVKPFVLAALHSGLRYSKLLDLKWNDVNLEERIIKVENAKSKKVRFIPINSVLFDELTKLKSEKGKGQRVFPFKSVRTAFENARKKACIEDVTFHDLRRTFGTRLLERGVDIVTISKLYGHSNVLVTQGYLHPKDTLSKEAVELLVENPSEKVKKEEKLLQMCDTKSGEKLQKFAIHSFSMN